MNLRFVLSLALTLAILTACGGGSNDSRAVPTPPVTNDGGDPVTGVLTAQFDPTNSLLPFPINLLFLGTTDLTLNVPAADPTDFGDPAVALSSMDGFSTTAPWTANFFGASGGTGQIQATSVVPGSSVRLFQVSTGLGSIAPTGIIRELVPGQDFVATLADADTIAILPTRPLQELSVYMAVLTTGIRDTNGNDATPDQTYFLTKRTSPLVDANGNSTEPLIDNATAQALEPLRQIVNAQEAVAASAGIDPDDIVLSWTATTQSITPIQSVVQSLAQPAPITLAPTGLDTTAIGGAGAANIWMGVISLPYFLGVPSAQNPTAALTDFWTASPGAYIPPFDQFGLDPTSTALTVANPIPVMTDVQTVPVLMSVPKTPKPANGYPVAIFLHGITRNRTDMLGLADSMAAGGFAVIAIDHPIHGVVPDVEPSLAPFYIENTPFGAVANERTFDMDLQNNMTGAPGPDGAIDPSGAYAINLQSLLTARDNLRQANFDLSTLAATLFDGVDIDGDSSVDLDASNIGFIGQSWGAFVGTPFLAVEPLVSNGLLSVPGAGLAAVAQESPTFAPRINAGLAAAGIEPGSADYQQFFVIFQTIADSVDPANWGALAAASNTVLLHEVIGDTVVPNSSAISPTAGTDNLIRLMGLEVINATTQDPMGLRVAAKFVPPASHGSLLSPATSPAATAEMQGQLVSFMLSAGTAVQVNDPSVLASE